MKFIEWLKRQLALVLATALVLFAYLKYSGLDNWLTGLGRSFTANTLGWTGFPASVVHFVVTAIGLIVIILAVELLLKTAWWALPAPTDTTGMPLEKVRRIRHRRHVIAWVFAGAASSVLFPAATVAVLLAGYYSMWLKPAAVTYIATEIWPYVCIAEIIMQMIPMNARQQTQGWDVIADQWTSFFPLIGCVIVLAAMYFGGFGMDAEGWRIWNLSFFTGVAEMLLLAIGNKLIAAARGSEETPV